MNTPSRCRIVLAASLLAGTAQAACPPASHDRAALDVLAAAQFELADATERNALALDLLDCTAATDPALRDGIAFSGLSHWLRAGALTRETRGQARGVLLAQLRDAPDAAGFRPPFAALVLSEVVRADRLDPAFSPDDLAGLVQAAAGYLRGVRDYRGFVAGEGWRHGVAHGADLALQLLVHPGIEPAAMTVLLEAVAAQVAPAGEVFYIHGEPERLARAVHFAQRRGQLTPLFWTRWLERLVDPAPLPSWSAAYASQAGLARRHNIHAFLQALLFAATQADDAPAQAFAAQVRAALVRVLSG